MDDKNQQSSAPQQHNVDELIATSQPVSYTTSSSSRRPKAGIFIIVGVLIIGAAGGIFFLRSLRKPAEKPQSTSDTSGVVFTTPDKTISARFPGTPTESAVPSSIPGTTITASKVEAWNYQVGRSVIYGLVEMHVPKNQTVTASSVAEGTTKNATDVTRKSINISGNQANQVKATFTRDNVPMYITIVVIEKKGIIYMLSYADTNNSDQIATNFVNSITLK